MLRIFSLYLHGDTNAHRHVYFHFTKMVSAAALLKRRAAGPSKAWNPKSSPTHHISLDAPALALRITQLRIVLYLELAKNRNLSSSLTVK